MIKTDHRSLLFLIEQRANTKLQQKALLKLMDLQFSIQYRQGSINVAADVLSRCSSLEAVYALSAYTPTWITNLVQEYSNDPMAVKLLEPLAVSKSNDQGYTLTDGV